MDKRCTLTDKELISKSQEWISKLAKSGGDDWVLRVPVDFNHDPDMLFSELCNRLAEKEARIAKLENALQPLACLSLVGATGAILYQRDNTKILVGDVRHAKQLLTPTDNQLNSDK